MAVDETQSLEYKSIPNTYQSVCFVKKDNDVLSIYTGDGHILPLSSNISSNTTTVDGDINIENTLSCYSYKDGKALYNDDIISIDMFNGTQLNQSNVSYTVDTNSIDWLNPKSIVTNKAVNDKFGELQISLDSMIVNNVFIDKDNGLIRFSISQPKTIVYVIPCKIEYQLGYSGNAHVEVQAECNGIVGSKAQFSLLSYYEKWRDNPQKLRITDNNRTSEFVNYCTLIGSVSCGAGSSVIRVTYKNIGGYSGLVECTIDENNVLILGR